MLADLRRLAAGFLLLLLLVACQAQAAEDIAALHRQHDGGTLRLVAETSYGTIDPHINYTSGQALVFYVTYDQLVTFRRAQGDAGNQIVPDLAEAMPDIQDGGRTYIFHLRQNIRFSNGHVLNTADVVASMVRLFKVQNPNSGSWYNIIIGGDDCVSHPQTCTLKDGVVPDEAAHTVTFHLLRADSEFLDKLAFPFATILPADTPAADLGTNAAPGTGAYRIVSYDPRQKMILERNPYFKEFSADAQPRGFADRMEYTFGLDGEAAVTAVINNQYDWMFNPKPLDRLTEIGSKYANRTYLNVLPETYYAPLNVNMLPFSNKNARLAFAYGVDRRALAKLFGGTHMGYPLCQQIPRGIDGHQEYCPFTLNPDQQWSAPDMAKARQYMRESGMIGQKVTLITQDGGNMRAMGEYLRSFLQSLGFDAKMKAISQQIQFNYIQNTNNKVQISLTDWTSDYPAPSDYLNVLLSCANFHPGSDNSVNMSGYCDPNLDAQMNQALTLANTDTTAANALWARIDRQATDTAAQVTLMQAGELDIVSTRLGHYTWCPLMHMMFSLVWVQ